MAWPPPTLPINRTNATPQLDTHAADHNALALAINDVTALLGPAPKLHVDGGYQSIASHVMTGGGAVITVTGGPAVPYPTTVYVNGWVAVASDSSAVAGIWCQVWSTATGVGSVVTETTATTAGGSYAMVPVIHSFPLLAYSVAGFSINAAWAGGSTGTIYAAASAIWHRYKA
jgi:hypothetical protein